MGIYRSGHGRSLNVDPSSSLARRRIEPVCTKAHHLRGSRAVSHKVDLKILRWNPILQLGLLSI